jgi:hypothetical protein
MGAVTMLTHVFTWTLALGGSAIVVAGAWALGRGVLAALGAGAKRLPLPITCVIGACSYGTLFTALSLLHAAHAWLIAAIGIAPILVLWRDLRVRPDWLRSRLEIALSGGVTGYLLLATCLVYASYDLILCLANFYGADLLVYHLTIPRDILDNHGFRFNPYFLAAGLPLGWHHFALLGWVLGGERGYLALSFWAFVGLLSLAHSLLRKGDEPVQRITGLLGAAVVAYVVAGMSRESLPNNDVPLMLLEGTALALALCDFGLSWAQRGILVGLVTGFALSVKTQSLFFLPFLAATGYFGARERRFASVLLIGAVAAPLALAWPLNTLWHTGSPLPLVANSLHLSGTPLPHLAETLAYSAQRYGLWLRVNFARFFSQGMFGFPLILAGLPLGLLCSRSYRRDPLVRALLGFALVRYAGLCLATLDPQIVYHDRYHMIVYGCLGLAAILGWLQLGPAALRLERSSWARGVAAVSIVLCLVELAYPLTMWSPRGDSMSQLDREDHPSMLNQMIEALKAPSRAYGTDIDSVWAFVEANTPATSTVATTSIITYGYRRRFISLLPNTQGSIDLGLPPEELLDGLRRLGVEYVHLAPVSNQNGFMEPLFAKALSSVRKIPELSGVALVHEKLLASGVPDRLYYVGDSSTGTRPADALKVLEGRILGTGVGRVAARRGGSTRVVLDWTPAPFADCEIEVSEDGKPFVALDIVPGATGHFVLRQASPDVNYLFRVRTRWRGAVSEWSFAGAGQLMQAGE